jgi:predicted DNA-binding protein
MMAKAGRPPVLDETREAFFSCKLSEEEDQQLKELVKASGMSKSELIRRIIKITYMNAMAAFNEGKAEAKKLLQQGNFNMDSFNAFVKVKEDALEKALNRMVYDEAMEKSKKKCKDSE